MQYLLIAFSITFLVLIILIKTRLAHIALDKPNHRSLHTAIIPRTGGLAILFGVLATWYFLNIQFLWFLLLLVLMIISLIDDIRGLAIGWRLISQLVVGMLFVYFFASGLIWWKLVLIVLALIWMTNLYNFMDGSDGLAGGMALFGFGFYAIAAYLAHDIQIALMNGCIASASLAFVMFNFYPARIFMGDVGSVPLGFLAGSMGFYGWQIHIWSAWFPVLVFSPFIVDASVTLLKRVMQKEKIWQAHRSHYYQRLVQIGWGHRKTALYEYGLMFAVGLSALMLRNAGLVVQSAGLLCWVGIFWRLMRTIDREWSNSES